MWNFTRRRQGQERQELKTNTTLNLTWDAGKLLKAGETQLMDAVFRFFDEKTQDASQGFEMSCQPALVLLAVPPGLIAVCIQLSVCSRNLPGQQTQLNKQKRLLLKLHRRLLQPNDSLQRLAKD